MLYSASSCLSSASSRGRSRSMEGGTGLLSRDQEPHERQPQLARVWDRTIVDQHFGRVRGTDNLEEIAEPRRVAGPEARAVAARRTGADLAEFRRAARDLERRGKLRNVERRKHQPDPERTRLFPHHPFLQP